MTRPLDDDLTSRMLWDAAQRAADRPNGKDEKFVRLLWMAQVLASIEAAERINSNEHLAEAEAVSEQVRKLCEDGSNYLLGRNNEWAHGYRAACRDVLRVLDGER